MSERINDTNRLDGETEGAVDEPVTTQGERGDTAGTAAQSQAPEYAHDATGPAVPPPRAENARDAAGAAGEDTITEAKQDIAPGGTIETALTPSGTASMVASQLLWDGSSATSRIDESIAAALPDEEANSDKDANPEEGPR
ncbi:hypothetical protein [Microbispora sp. NPDC049125]|uniref:hypothetical protein n=1 Tax=Microbispora sp. NPDC049125 TaxID=3154929 RepID=UPI0034678F3F